MRYKTIQQSVSEDPAIQGLKKERKKEQSEWNWSSEMASFIRWEQIVAVAIGCFITKGNINERSGPSFSDVSMYVSFDPFTTSQSHTWHLRERRRGLSLSDLMGGVIMMVFTWSSNKYSWQSICCVKSDSDVRGK